MFKQNVLHWVFFPNNMETLSSVVSGYMIFNLPIEVLEVSKFLDKTELEFFHIFSDYVSL